MCRLPDVQGNALQPLRSELQFVGAECSQPATLLQKSYLTILAFGTEEQDLDQKHTVGEVTVTCCSAHGLPHCSVVSGV